MAVQRVRDPLNDLVEFDVENDELEFVLWKVIQTRPFQRLRRIKQLGFSDLVYPGTSHSRLSHSIGVYHTARQLMKVVRKKVGIGPNQLTREQRALAAALLHDLGHGPFSHTFEKVGERLGLPLANHEYVSDALIRNGEVSEILNDLGSGFAIDVADIIKKDGRITVHNAVVSSQFDADRLDYMRRDRLMTGTQHAAIDFEWLMANLEIAPVPIGLDDMQTGTVETFVIGPKAIHAAEAYVLGLFQLYPTVYFHKATRGAEKLFTELLVRAIELSRDESHDKVGLPKHHPIVRFSKSPDNIDTLLCLDDAVMSGSLTLMTDSQDPTISQLSLRLRDRKLFKCIDIRAIVMHQLDPDGSGEQELMEKVDACCASINNKITAWTDDNKRDFPRVLIDEASRTPYKSTGGSKGPLERINVRTSGGQLVDLKQLSRVVANLEKFVLFRAYVADEDAEAREAVRNSVNEGIKQCH